MFVKGRCNLGDEDGVFLFDKRLTLFGVESMDGVTRFMCEREDILKLSVEVEEDERMDVRVLGLISAGSLTRMMIDIDIAIAGDIMSFGLEVRGELLNRTEEEFSCFLEGVFLIRLS